MEGTPESTLRAKYLDWCSARLAERFLDLSPEAIYALARPEGGESRESGESGPGASREPGEPAESTPPPSTPPGRSRDRLPHPTEEGYRALVQRVTEALLRRTSLPTYEQWAEAYAESPERFEAELLGFWKDAVASEGAEEAGSG